MSNNDNTGNTGNTVKEEPLYKDRELSEIVQKLNALFDKLGFNTRSTYGEDPLAYRFDAWICDCGKQGKAAECRHAD